MLNQTLIEKVNTLKKEKKAVILAHNYQRKEVQEIADYVDDSLALSRYAARTDAEVIVLCGVHFMAESAAMLAPEKIVLLPEKRAGCPMADMVTAEGLRELKSKHPDAAVVTYINSSAAVKAETDICCTSANAVSVVRSLPEKKIIFAPDKNLGSYVQSQLPEKEIILWPGFCPTHQKMTAQSVLDLRKEYPEALVMVHPECPSEVIQLADFVQSTTGIIKKVQESNSKEFIICTEFDLTNRLVKEAPEKKFYFPQPKPLCSNMKLTTLEKVIKALETLQPRITVEKETAAKAKLALEKMLSVGK
ncbi:MAG: quinolinate synthase NadA [bacterium]